MIATNLAARPISDSPRSGKRKPFAVWQCDHRQKLASSRASFVVFEYATERFDADNLLALGERLVGLGRGHKKELAEAFSATHVAHVDPNLPHECGLYIARR